MTIVKLISWCLVFLPITCSGTNVSEELIKAGAKMNNRVAAFMMTNPNEGNFMFSPFSLGSALGMLLLGAKGNTEKQMLTLYQEKTTNDVSKYWHEMIKAWPKGVELNSANRIYADKSVNLLPEYMKAVKKFYYADPKQVDFGGQPEKAKETINAYIADATKNMIPTLIKSVASNTKAVVVNALYFQAEWEDKFDRNQTEEIDFHVNKDTKVKVPMMRKKSSFKFTAMEDAMAVEIPFQGKELSMIFILPNEGTDLESIEKKVYDMDIAKWKGEMRPRTVNLLIPRFEYSTEINMKEALAKGGMTDIFEKGAADLSGLSDTPGLYVSQMIQKNVIKIDEEGGQAASATAVVLVSRSAPPKPVEFKADRPFMYLLGIRASDVILYAGRVVNPSSS